MSKPWELPPFINGLRVVQMYCIHTSETGPVWRIEYRKGTHDRCGVDYRGQLEGEAFQRALSALNQSIGEDVVTAEAVRAHPGAVAKVFA